MLSGLRLPISQAWPSVLPYSGPRTALPFGQYDAPLLVFLACAAARLAVLVGQVVGGRHGRAGTWVGAGVALVGLVVTLVQTLRVVSPLQAPGIEAGLVVDSAVAAAVLGTVVGLLALAWVVPAVATAASYVVAYARSVDVSSTGGQAELVDAGVQVLGMALSPGDRSVAPLVLAVALGLVLRIARSRARASSGEDDQPDPEPVVAGSGTSVG